MIHSITNSFLLKKNSKDASGVSNRKINKSNIDTSINSFQIEHGRKEGNKFILEGITNFIMKSLESYDGKLIIEHLKCLLQTIR